MLLDQPVLELWEGHVDSAFQLIPERRDEDLAIAKALFTPG